MRTKTFKIGESAIGGIIIVTVNKNVVIIEAKDWNTKNTLRSHVVDLFNKDGIFDALHELTTSYYADKINDFINK